MSKTDKRDAIAFAALAVTFAWIGWHDLNRSGVTLVADIVTGVALSCAVFVAFIIVLYYGIAFLNHVVEWVRRQ